MANGSYGDYYTTKGTGSQDVYDAYYEDYGTSSVWGGVNVDTQSNIAGALKGGEAEFITTKDSIEQRAPDEPGMFMIIALAIGVCYLTGIC